MISCFGGFLRELSGSGCPPTHFNMTSNQHACHVTCCLFNRRNWEMRHSAKGLESAFLRSVLHSDKVPIGTPLRTLFCIVSSVHIGRVGPPQHRRSTGWARRGNCGAVPFIIHGRAYRRRLLLTSGSDVWWISGCGVGSSRAA